MSNTFDYIPDYGKGVEVHWISRKAFNFFHARDNVFDYSRGFGDFVVVAAYARFGLKPFTFFIEEFVDTEYWAVRLASSCQCTALFNASIGCYPDGRVTYYEVWHILDDDSHTEYYETREALERLEQLREAGRIDADSVESIPFSDSFFYCVLFKDDYDVEQGHVYFGTVIDALSFALQVIRMSGCIFNHVDLVVSGYRFDRLLVCSCFSDGALLRHDLYDKCVAHDDYYGGASCEYPLVLSRRSRIQAHLLLCKAQGWA